MQHQDTHDPKFTTFFGVNPLIVGQDNLGGEPIHGRKVLYSRADDMNPL